MAKGGNGALVTSSSISVSAGTQYTIVVGAGGAYTWHAKKALAKRVEFNRFGLSRLRWHGAHSSMEQCRQRQWWQVPSWPGGWAQELGKFLLRHSGDKPTILQDNGRYFMMSADLLLARKVDKIFIMLGSACNLKMFILRARHGM